MPEYNTLADELQRLVDVTDAIGEAITNQGGTVDYYDRLEQYPADIATIGTNIGTKTITDDSIIEFVGDGNPLLEYTIKGNMVQSGTPTPTSPITPSECGEMSINIVPPIENWVDGYPDAGDGGITPATSYKEKTSTWVKIKNNTSYAFSVPNGFPTSAWRAIAWYRSNGQFIRRDSGYSSDPLIVISPDTAYYARFSFRTQGQSINAMVNEGETALPYEPYGQYKLPIDINDSTVNMYIGEVETTRRIKKLVLTGDETYTADAEYSRFITIFPNAKIEGLRLTQVFCTHFISVYDGRPISEVPNNSIYSSDVVVDRFFIKTTDYTTATDFKTYLAQQYAAGTPVTVWYVLAEPTTGVVNEPLRKIGDYVDTVTGPPPTVPTIEGTNTLKVDTTLNPSETFIKYRYIENITLLGEKTITSDGVYNATDDNLDGYSTVIVNYDTSSINNILESVNDSLETSIGSNS